MPRHSKSSKPAPAQQTLIIDNGAYTMKAGFAASSPAAEGDCHVIANCIARGAEKKTWVGPQLENCKDFAEMVFRRPVEKGYLVSWEAEKEIWDTTFFDKGAKIKCNPQETNLILTEAPNTPTALQANTDQVIFEEYEFASYYRCIGPSLNAYNDIPTIMGDQPDQNATGLLPAECVLVIDSGYSHTTVTPVYKGQPIQQAIRRLDIGGKFLTNYLKEAASRKLDVIDETHLMNEVKEAVCYVSEDFTRDLERTWKGSRKGSNDITVDYVMPDYTNILHGFMRPHDPLVASKMNKMGGVPGPDGTTEYVLTLGNERFAVPELLFNPGDVGSKQPGLSETVMQSLSGLPPGLWPVMLANVLVIGGNANINGFMDRLSTELRQLAPAECVVRVIKAPNAIKSTWLGGSRLASDKALLKNVVVTRQEYQEHGSQWLSKRFTN